MSRPGLSSALPGGGRWTGGRWDDGTTCVLAPNPGLMTLDGTNTWVMTGAGAAVVADPGPAHEGHLLAALQAATRGEGEPVTRLQVWLTHGHLDHSAGAVRFAELAAEQVRRAVPIRALDPGVRLGAEGLVHGDRLDLGERSLLVEATPGHTSDSLSFVLETPGGQRALLTGDTVLGRGTTVVAHPDGALAPYLASLHRLRELSAGHEACAVLPGHGPVLRDAHTALEYYLNHRRERLDAVRAAVEDLRSENADSDGGTPELVGAVVARVYADVDEQLWPAARLSVAAQLEYLSGRGD